MAHLFTNHDKFHIHKTLGFLALANFLLRFYYAIIYGNSFPDFEPKIISCSLVLVHALLPIASLTIPLPEKRNFSSPMIWREFRLHSILFSCRHVLFTLATILKLWPSQSNIFFTNENKIYSIITECVIKYLLIIGCIKMASIITEKYGDKEKRTTNAMPYPINLIEEEIQKIKLEYSKKQFGATILAIFPGDIGATLNFSPLYAIQAAAFMMTLVRKGKCQTIHYHRVYSLSLLYPLYLYHVIVRAFYSQFADFIICQLYIFIYKARIYYKWGNYKIWAIVVPTAVVSLIALPNIEKKYICENSTTIFLRYLCSITLIINEIISDYNIYKPFMRKSNNT
jgi:hypothetical protein